LAVATESHVVLRDGSRVLIRPLRADDRQRLRAHLEQLSRHSRYLRYHAAMPRVSERLVDYMTAVDQCDHVALVAVDEDRAGQPVIGEARYVRMPTCPEVAEAAITVADEYQGRGLGTLLLGVLGQRARSCGVSQFRSYVLGSNRAMLELLDELGAVRHLESDDVFVVDVAIPDDPRDLPETAAGRVLRAVAASGTQG
jgi:GNAT superfamily N-acetyltransferase